MDKRFLTPLKGFRDFLPQHLAIRNKVKSTLTEVFSSYGFQPLETPDLEYQEVLLGKYGPEADKLVYTFKDKGNRAVGMRYDLTVPTARVAAAYGSQLPTPFKRYQIQRVWRADKPQLGRYREFEQCDIDILNSTSPLADAEIIAVIHDSLKALNLPEFTIRLNSRSILFSLIEGAGVKPDQSLSVISSIDKLDKKTPEEVKQELADKGLFTNQIDSLFTYLDTAKPDAYLQQVVDMAQKLGVSSDYYRFDPSLARGLDYYTGPIFETVVTSPKIGSVTGGGRYDHLISSLGGPDWPAVGSTIGLDRICDVITANNLMSDASRSSTTALATIFSPEFIDASTLLTRQLRSLGIPVEIYLGLAPLPKQLKFADKKHIPYALIIGSDEVKANQITVKNLSTGAQETLSLDKVISLLKS